MAIARAGQLAVDFEFVPPWNQPVSPNLSAVLGANMHRFRSIRWAWEIREVDLTLRAPLLESFDNRYAFYEIRSEFLGGAAGCLRTLCLGNAVFPDSCPALETVTCLRASYPWYIDTPLRFERIFALCPQLVVLNLRNISARTTIGLPAAPFPPTLEIVKLHALVDCNLVQMYSVWAHGVSLPHVRLEMALTPAYNVAPFLDGAIDLAMTFECESKTHIVANLPSARTRTLVLNEQQVVEPARVLANVFRDMTPATTAHVRSLRVPLSVLHHVLSAGLHWPGVARLVVDMFAHDGHDTTPHEPGETYQCFRWSTLDCLHALSQRFPAVTAFSLALYMHNPADGPTLKDGRELLLSYVSALKMNNPADRPTLEDACELLQYVASQSTGRFPIARVHGFPADVVRAVADEAPTHPCVHFVVDGGAII